MTTPLTTTTPGSRFRVARERAGLTQVQVAASIRTKQSAISDFERGQRDISLDRLHTWCVACGINPHEVDERLASRDQNG